MSTYSSYQEAGFLKLKKKKKEKRRNLDLLDIIDKSYIITNLNVSIASKSQNSLTSAVSFTGSKITM